MDRVVAAAVSLVLAFTVQLLIRMARDLWWKPLQQMNHFQCHAITGPPYKLLFGNTKEMRIMARESRSKPMPLCHQILPRVLPHYTTWTQMFGKDYVHWFGPTPRLNVEDPKQMKQILSDRLGYFGKTRRDPLVRNLAGNHGITRADGEKWAQHRRILTPAFYMDNLNGMIPAMISSVGNMLDSWLKSITSGKNEIEVLKDFCSLSADVIARTAFGVSYIEGKRIFDLQAEQAVLVVEALQSVYVPGLRFLPTKKNRYRWKLKREIERSFKQLIEGREHSLCRGRSDSYGNDLLGIMMDANKAEVQQGRKAYQRLSRDEIIDDCKTFFFAGRETTSSLLTWTMVLLGMHPTWQDRARKEVIEICGHDPPSSQNINRLKIVEMVLNECLRLYPPSVTITRETYREKMELGSVCLRKGTQLVIPTIAIHHDRHVWGDDADEFNPERFGEGIGKACKQPWAFMPFGMGPRICVGQNFAMQEAKIAVAMILQRFAFHLSPNYIHAPTATLMLQPQHGAQIILHQICS